MFAMSYHTNSTKCGSELALFRCSHFYAGQIINNMVSVVPPRGGLMRPQHFVDVTSSGKARIHSF